MTASADLPEVTVAVVTYRRTDLLRRLLPALVEQAASVEHPTSVLVVDNDPLSSAKDVAAGFLKDGVVYVVEPTPGIAAARNRAIDESTAARFLVFIDDDECPADGWLLALLNTRSQFACSAVVGPVVSTFEASPSPWVEGSQMFDTTERATGTIVEGAATNNLLLDLVDLRRNGLRFDERFGLTGGSDSMLTRRMSSQGLQIRWCAEARVTELVPSHRATRRWVLSRTLRTSNAWSRVVLALSPSPLQRGRSRIELTARALVRAARGSSGFLHGAVRSDVARRATAECELMNSIGMLTGAWGVVRSEYARTELATVAIERASVVRSGPAGSPSEPSRSLIRPGSTWRN